MSLTKAKVLRNAAAVLLAAAFVAGCNQHKNANEKFGRGGGHGLRMACATEIQKFCSDEPRKRRCLRDNIDKLSDSCKAALAQHRGHKARNGENGDND